MAAAVVRDEYGGPHGRRPASRGRNDVTSETSPDRCALCDRPVLGLAGQDWSLLPWMLDPSIAEGEVFPGSCHVRCLRDLGLGRLWAEAVQEYYCRRWPRWRTGLSSGIRWRLHVSPQARRFHLWRSDGTLSSFPYGAVLSGLVSNEIGEVGTEHSAVLLAAMGTADSGVAVPLADVIAALDLTDRYPRSSGVLARKLRNLGTPARPETVDVLLATCPLRLDVPCRRAAHELIRTPV